MSEEDWQPIETAPKNRTCVDLLGANGRKDYGVWEDYSEMEYMPGDGEWNTYEGEGPFTHWKPRIIKP